MSNEKKKTVDDIVEWVPVDKYFMAKDISGDQLCVMLKILIARVKEDHARLSYKKDIADYAIDITQIFNFANKHGYKPVDYKEIIKNQVKEKDEKFNKIMDA